LCTQIVNQEPLALELWVPDYPPRLAEIVALCLRKKPEDRFDSVAALSAALSRFVAEAGIPCSTNEIATYMRELFPGAARQSMAPGMGTPPPRTSAQTPRGKTPLELDQTIALGSGPKARENLAEI